MSTPLWAETWLMARLIGQDACKRVGCAHLFNRPMLIDISLPRSSLFINRGPDDSDGIVENQAKNSWRAEAGVRFEALQLVGQSLVRGIFWLSLLGVFEYVAHQTNSSSVWPRVWLQRARDGHIFPVLLDYMWRLTTWTGDKDKISHDVVHMENNICAKSDWHMKF